MKRMILIILVMCGAALAGDRGRYSGDGSVIVVVKPTGGNNDQTNINNALVQASLGKGEVLLTGGQYLVSTPILMPSDVTLRGVGAKTNIKLVSGSDDSVISNLDRSGGNTDIVIRDFTIDANKAGNTYSASVGAVDFLKVVGFEISGIQVIDSDRVGMQITNSSRGCVEKCHVLDPTADGIAVNISCFNITVTNNTVDGAGVVESSNAGIEIQDGVSNIVVSNNTIENSYFGIEVSTHTSGSSGISLAGVSITGNTIDEFIFIGITLQGQTGDTTVKDIAVSGNTLTTTSTSSARPIMVNDVDSANIVGNITDSPEWGFIFAGVCNNILLDGNTFNCNETDRTEAVTGISTSGTISNIRISNNMINNFTWTGINLAGDFDAVVIEGNAITGLGYTPSGEQALYFRASSTYTECIIRNNTLSTGPLGSGTLHLTRDDIVSPNLFDQLPVGVVGGNETYNKRVLLAATTNLEIDETGKLFYCDTASNAITVNLPAATPGLEFSFVLTDATTAQSIRLEPDGTETIALANGVQEAADDYITNTTAEAVGDSCRLRCSIVGQWEHFDSVGTWTGE